MSKIPKALGLNEPLRHQDHPRPRTRREFLSIIGSPSRPDFGNV